MKVTVRLIAMIAGDRSPADDERAVDIAEGATAAEVLASLALPASEACVTLVNGEALAVGARARRRLRDGDVLTVFPPLKGG